MEIIDILNNFKINGAVLSFEPNTNGLINKTFIVKTTNDKYIFQTINTYVFKDVDSLMNNIYMTTNYLNSIGVETLELIKTLDDKLYFSDEEGSYRCFKYVEHSVTYNAVKDLKMIELDGKAFGKLHKDLVGMDASKLKEIIEDFHNTPVRYQNLVNASQQNIANRKSKCLSELSIARGFGQKVSLIVDGLNDGTIHFGVTHNDPKINNVLFDEKTDAIRCIIDLDTIMPGSFLYDYGDALRSLFTGDNESSFDTSLLKVDFNIFEAYTKGYLSETKSILTPREVELLPYSIFLLACELGFRFLEDYLNGDKYFKTTFSGENLVRARGQFALATSIENNMTKLNNIVNKLMK